jgi:carbon monoxide dehydrogenase subunit G
MHLEHEFVVPVPVKQAWQVLLDVERIAPCLPGATVDSVQDDTFAGRVKVKVGPISVTYQGNATFEERDESAHRVVLKANGREARGAGTAAATVEAVLHDEGEHTRVRVDTELAITGRPAQFGRGVMVDVSNKLLGTFADCLERTLAADQPAPVAAAISQPASEPAPAPAAAVTEVPRSTPDAIDLLETAGAPVLKRVLPVVAVVAALVVLWRLLRRIGS